MPTQDMNSSLDYRREIERSGPVSLQTKLFYASGELPGAYMNLAIGGFLLLYYNQILGASPAAVSAALGIALLLDAISDPLVGAFSDRVKSRLGRRHPLMYAAALPMGIFICLLFSPPQELVGALLMVWLFVFLVLTRLTFTVFSVPWSALIAELSEDYAERTIISSYRILVGALLGGLSGFLIFNFWFGATEQFPQGQLNPDNYSFFGPLIGLLMTLWSLVSTHFTRREIPYLLQPTESVQPNFSAMLSLILSALQSRNYRIVLISILIYFGILGTLGQFDMYINTYFWRLSGEQIGTIGLFGILAPIFAFLSAPLLQRNFQKHHLLCFALIVQMLLSMAAVAFRLSGLFPPNESVWFLPLLGSFSVVGGFLSVVGAMVVFSMTADLADEQEYRFKTRQEGVLASGIAFSTKAVGSVGVVVSGFLLEFFIGFPVGQTATEIEEDVLFRLAITDAVIVNCFVLIPAFLITRYNLTRESMAVIQSELRSRRSV